MRPPHTSALGTPSGFRNKEIAGLRLLTLFILLGLVTLAPWDAARAHARSASTGPGMNVHLRTSNGSYVVVEGEAIRATSSRQGWPETFVLVDRNGGSLMSGDPVHLEAQSGRYVVAEDGGGREVNADRTAVGRSEIFTVVKVGGSGEIRPGDRIALRAYSGHYVVAENGGGGAVNANRTVIGPWEIFTLETASGVHTIPVDEPDEPPAPPVTDRPANLPLKLFWHPGRSDKFTTAASASFAGREGYSFARLEGDVFTRGERGTVPLKLYWQPERQDCFTTATEDGERSALEAGYQFVRIEACIFPAAASRR